MKTRWNDLLKNDLNILLLLGLARLVVHTLTNGQYGFHRDELAFLSDPRHLDWGFVAYPPLTPMIVRAGYELFGASLVGLRFFSALAQSIAMVLTGLMAREMGGSRTAQVLAAVAAGIAPMALIMGAMFQYISFDYLWWVCLAYSVVRLLKSENPKWWLAIGVFIGLGMMTKYTMAFAVAGLAAGVLLTPARKSLKSKWLWAGAGISLLIFLPNLLWQIQHDFISLDFLSVIHTRDVAIGRADDFFLMQFVAAANPFLAVIWLVGLYACFVKWEQRYRVIGWMYLVPLVLFFLAEGRFYYMAPAYPMLLAAGAVAACDWLSTRSRPSLAWGFIWTNAALGAAMGAVLMLPIHPVNSDLFNLASDVQDNWVEQIGWPELAETTAQIYASLAPDEQAVTGILAGNYGEAGAIELFGPEYGLPQPISPINSFSAHGYGDPAPETVILIGYSQEFGETYFHTCKLAGQITNDYGVLNEETLYHADIFLCRGLKLDWDDFWQANRRFG